MRAWLFTVALTAASVWALPVLLDSGLKGVAILALASITALAMRRASAAARHLVWSLSMLGLLLLPVLSAVLPAWQVLPRWAVLSTDEHTTPIAIESSPRVDHPQTFVEVPATPHELPPADQQITYDPLPVSAAVPQEIHNAPSLTLQPVKTQPWLNWTWREWLLLVWLCGALIGLTRVLLGILCLRLLQFRSKRISDAAWLAQLETARSRLRLRQTVVLLRSRHNVMPMTWSIFRPKLLLPRDCDTWSSERCRVVLLHELAHIKRGDCLTHLLMQLAGVLHWFNPLIWVASRRIAIERERACDDLVLAAGSKASDYAEHLVQVAAGSRTQYVTSAAAIAMARPSTLEGRLRAILDPRRTRGRLTRMSIIVAMVLMACVLLPVSTMRARTVGDESAAKADDDQTTNAANASQPSSVPDGIEKRIDETGKMIPIAQHGNAWSWKYSTWGGRKQAFTRAVAPTDFLISESDGLVNNGVSAIAQLPDGAMVFGSEHGMSIWKDDTITIHTGPEYFMGQNVAGNSPLPHNEIQDLLVTTDGSLWIATRQGACVIRDGRWDIIEPQRHDDLQDVRCLHQARNGKIILGSRQAGITVFDPRANETKIIHSDLDVNHWVSAISEDAEGNLWIAVCNVGVFRYDWVSLRLFTDSEPWIPSLIIRSICVDRQGALWVGTWKGLGVRFADGTSRVFTSADALPENMVWNLRTLRNGDMWAVTQKGIAVFDGKVWKYPTLSGNSILWNSDVFEDADGHLWVGTGLGVIRDPSFEMQTKNPAAAEIETIKNQIEAQFPDVVMSRMRAKDHAGRIWTSADKKLLRFNGSQWDDLSAVLDGTQVSFIQSDSNGRIWVDTIGAGLACYDDEEILRYNNDPDKSAGAIRCMAETSTGLLYFAAQQGIFTWEKKQWNQITDRFQAISIVVDKNDCLWLADVNYGLFVYDDKTFKPLSNRYELKGCRIEKLESRPSGAVRASTVQYTDQGTERVQFDCDMDTCTRITPPAKQNQQLAPETQPAKRSEAPHYSTLIESVSAKETPGGGLFHWRIQSQKTTRLQMVWYTVVDGRISGYSENTGSPQEDGTVDFHLEVGPTNGTLRFRMAKAWKSNDSEGTVSLVKSTDYISGADMRIRYVHLNAQLREDPIPIWQAQWWLDGKLVKTVGYSLRVIGANEPDDPPTLLPLATATPDDVPYVVEALVLPKATRAFTGRVVDASDRPLPGIRVRYGLWWKSDVKAIETVTDKEGRYYLPVTHDDPQLWLIVYGKGWAPRWQIRLTPGTVEEPKVVDFKLEPAHHIEGEVVDQAGQPISGVRIQVRTKEQHDDFSFHMEPVPNGSPLPGISDVFSDAQGRFRFDNLPAGEVALNFTATCRHVNRNNYPVDKPVRIDMSGSGLDDGTIKIRVIDAETKQPIPRYLVTRRYLADQWPVASPEGTFSFEKLCRNGDHYLSVYTTEHAPKVLSVTAQAPAEVQETTVELNRGRSFKAVLLDARTQRPIAGAAILYAICEAGRNFEWFTFNRYGDGYGLHLNAATRRETTDANGMVAFGEGSEQGTLFIVHPGYARTVLYPRDRPAPDADGRVRILLQPEAVVSGVYAVAGVPQANVPLQLGIGQRAVVIAVAEIEQTLETVSTNDRGKFEYTGLAADTYRLFAPGVEQHFTLASGEHKTLHLNATAPAATQPAASPGQVRAKELSTNEKQLVSLLVAHEKSVWERHTGQINRDFGATLFDVSATGSVTEWRLFRLNGIGPYGCGPSEVGYGSIYKGYAEGEWYSVTGEPLRSRWQLVTDENGMRRVQIDVGHPLHNTPDVEHATVIVRTHCDPIRMISIVEKDNTRRLEFCKKGILDWIIRLAPGLQLIQQGPQEAVVRHQDGYTVVSWRVKINSYEPVFAFVEFGSATGSLTKVQTQRASLRIRFDIPGAEEEGEFQFDRGNREPIKIRNGGEATISNLPSGVYDFYRQKFIYIGDMGRGSWLDRQRVTLEDGKTTTVEVVRKLGQPLEGVLVGGYKEDHRAFIRVQPAAIEEVPKNETYKFPILDYVASNPDGTWNTALIPPGDYLITAEAHTPKDIAISRIYTGHVPPSFTGTAKVTVPKEGKPPRVRINMKSATTRPVASGPADLPLSRD